MSQAAKLNEPQPDLAALLAQSVASSKLATDAMNGFLAALEVQRKKDEIFPIDSGGLAKELMVFNRPAKLLTLVVYNAGAATSYLQIHDRHAPAAEGERPRLIIPVAPDSTESLDLPQKGIRFGNGIYICLSSTNVTKTLLTTNDCTFYGGFSYDN